MLPSELVDQEQKNANGNEQKTRLEATKPPTYFTTALKILTSVLWRILEDISIWDGIKLTRRITTMHTSRGAVGYTRNGCYCHFYGDSRGLVAVYRLVRKFPPGNMCDIGFGFLRGFSIMTPPLLLILRTTAVPTRNKTK